MHDRHLINYEYTKFWEDVSLDEFEGLLFNRLTKLFPEAIITIREGKNTYTISAGTTNKEFVSKRRLDEIAYAVFWDLTH